MLKIKLDNNLEFDRIISIVVTLRKGGLSRLRFFYYDENNNFKEQKIIIDVRSIMIIYQFANTNISQLELNTITNQLSLPADNERLDILDFSKEKFEQSLDEKISNIEIKGSSKVVNQKIEESDAFKIFMTLRVQENLERMLKVVGVNNNQNCLFDLSFLSDHSFKFQ